MCSAIRATRMRVWRLTEIAWSFFSCEQQAYENNFSWQRVFSIPFEREQGLLNYQLSHTASPQFIGVFGLNDWQLNVSCFFSPVFTSTVQSVPFVNVKLSYRKST